MSHSPNYEQKEPSPVYSQARVSQPCIPLTKPMFVLIGPHTVHYNMLTLEDMSI